MWYNAFITNVLSCGIPVALPPLVDVLYNDDTNPGELSATDLEQLTVTSLKNNRLWRRRSHKLGQRSIKTFKNSTNASKPLWIAPRFFEIKSSKSASTSRVDEGRFLLVKLGDVSRTGGSFLQVIDVNSGNNEGLGYKNFRGIDQDVILDSGNGLYYWTLGSNIKTELIGEILAGRE